MIGDRELLEAAARAGGYVLEWREDYQCMEYPNKPDFCWNPLESDADAFRLMVDCEIDVEYLNESIEASCWTRGAYSDLLRATETFGTDKHAATRRVITRAAAAMGDDNAKT
ncbi:hypothetical protein [Haliea salexigens]|uniref:hypothetical protein n=1 Tax=Haliea salexigens TaxID=287487 RepID=UPI000484B8D9|nr:hypothetical protein [Haliea salexigens]